MAQTAQEKAAAAEKAAQEKAAAEAAVPDEKAAAAAAEMAANPVVLEASGPKFDTTPTDAGIDPRTGESPAAPAGFMGQHAMEIVTEPGQVVQGVDPKAIPAEVTPGVTPDPGQDKLLAAAMAKAPSLTREFVDAFGLTDDYLADIAAGLVPPPPMPGPIHTADMYLTPGGWQQTPPGVPPQDVGKNAGR